MTGRSWNGSESAEQTGKSPLYKVGGDPHIPPPMIFAVINWLSITINILLIVFVIVCLLMSLLILMQRPKQEGLGAAFGGGVTDQVFGARTTNVLQRGTVYLGSMFFLLSLTLAILIGKQTRERTLLEPVGKRSKTEEVRKPVPVPKPVMPASLAAELPDDVELPVGTEENGASLTLDEKEARAEAMTSGENPVPETGEATVLPPPTTGLKEPLPESETIPQPAETQETPAGGTPVAGGIDVPAPEKVDTEDREETPEKVEEPVKQEGE